MAEGVDIEGVSNSDSELPTSSSGEVTQIDDFINENIAPVAPDYSNFVNSIQSFIDEGDGVESGFESGLPTDFSLSSGSSISISLDGLSTTEIGSVDADDGDISDFESDTDSLDAEIVSGELRTNDAAPQQADAARGGSAASAGVSGGAVGGAQSAASGVAAGQVAPAPPTARPTQASRPGRSGNIDQQQTSTVFDQLTSKVVITSVAIVPAVVLPSLTSTEASKLASLQAGDVQDLPEAEDDTPQDVGAAASDTTAAAEPQPVEEAPTDEVIVEPEVEEAVREEDGVPQEGGVETEATEAVVEPELVEAVESVEATASVQETLVEEITEEIIEAIEEAAIKDIEDEVIAAASDTTAPIIDAIVTRPEPVEPEPEPETPQPEPEEPVNNAPTISTLTDTGKDEDSAAYTIDLLSGSDDVDGDTLSVTNVAITAIDQDNASYTLPSGVATVSGSTLSINPAQLAGLDTGEQVVITVSYDVSDGTTATANTATVTLDGSNDAPTISTLTDTGKDEDSAAYTIDLLSGSDDVDGDTLSVTNVAITAIDQDNASYTLPSGVATVSGSTLSINPAQLAGLDTGEQVVITVSYDVSDGTTATANTATVTLDGSNDAPTISPLTDTGKDEDSAAYTIDLLSGSDDVDGDTLSVTNVAITAIDQDNASYTLPSGVATVSGSTLSINPAQLAGLDTGEQVVITVSYDVSDGTTATANTATVTLDGSNDAPTISPLTDTGKDEDSAAYTIDLLSGSDDVDGDTLSVTNVAITAIDQDNASYTLPSGVATVSGSTLSINPAQLAGLDTGEQVVITVSYDVSDGTTATANTATVTLDGSNDAPTISPLTDTGKDEDSAAYTIDLLSGSDDVDGDTLSVTNVAITAIDQDNASYTLPSGVATVSGSTLSINPAQLAGLDTGEQVVITVSYDVSDGTTATANTATVTLDGSNDAPTISPLTDTGKDEDSAAYTIDLLSGSDDVDGDTLSVTNVAITAIDQDNASYTLPSGVATVSGSTLSINPAQLAGLDTGEQVVITVSYDVSDGTTATANTATVTLDGSNDAPTISPLTDTGKDEDSAAYTIDLLSGSDDVDGDTLSVTNVAITAIDQDNASYTLPSGVATVSGSTLSINPAQLAGLDTGEQVVITVSYDVSDGTTATANTATVTLDGSNDAPTISPLTDTGKDEDSAAYTIDLLSGSDDVDGDTLSVTNVAITAIDQDNASYTLPSGVATVSGSTLSINPAQLAGLDTGEQVVITVSYDVSDGTTATANTATVTLDGSNDAPTISPLTDTGKDEDSAAYTIDLLSGSDDVDGDTLSVTNVAITAIDQDNASYTLPSGVATVSGSTLSINPAQLAGLDTGEQVVITVSYDVSDGTTATANTATVTLDGSNDAPTISPLTDTGKDEDSAAYTIDLLSGSDDVDGDTLSVTNVAITAIDQDNASYTLPSGVATVSGSTLSINPAQLAGLDTGEQVVITVSYDVSDGTTATANTATVTLDGSNDAPTANATTNTISEEDSTFTLDLLAAADDVDVEALTVSNARLEAFDTNDVSLGQVPSGNASVSGSTLTINPAAFDNLNDGQHVTVRVTYDVSDGDATITNIANVRVNGFTDPFVQFDSVPIMAIDENDAGDGAAVSVGQVSASGSGIVNYNFSNGTTSNGDFRIDTATGAISYVGTGLDAEDTHVEINTLTASFSGRYMGQPAIGEKVSTINLPDGFQTGDRVWALIADDVYIKGVEIRIDVTRAGVEITGLQAKYISTSGGRTVDNVDFDTEGISNTYANSNSVNGYGLQSVTINGTQFDLDVTTSGTEFAAGNDNGYELEVIAASDGETASATVRVDVNDIDEPPEVANSFEDLTYQNDHTSSIALADDAFLEPEGQTITYSATLADGSPLPGWLVFDAANLTLTPNGSAPTGRETIRITATSSSGSAFDDFVYVATTNIAQTATLTTTVTNWFQGTTQQNLDNIVDGNASTSGANDYAIHPTSADGRTITFSWDQDYTHGRFEFFNRTISEPMAERINGSTVTFNKDGTTVHTTTLQHTRGIFVEIVEPATSVVFDEVILTFDGSSQNFREIEIHAVPVIDLEVTSNPITENMAGDVNPVALGEVIGESATAVSYSFANGTTLDGDFRIDASSGAVTYVGAGLDADAYRLDIDNLSVSFSGISMSQPNIGEKISTVTLPDNFQSGDRVWALIEDDNYIKGVQLQIDAARDGIRITGTSAKFISTNGGNTVDNVDFDSVGTTRVFANGNTAYHYGVQSVTINGTQFDQDVTRTGTIFNAGSTNGYELAIIAADADGNQNATSFQVIVNDVNEAPVTNGAIGDQSVNEGEKLDLLLADDLFIDPEDDNLTLSAVMADGSALPDFIYFDSGQGQFTFEPATNDAQKYDIRVYASDGQLNTFAEFSLTVEDV